MKTKRVAKLAPLVVVLVVLTAGFVVWNHVARAATIINVTTATDEDSGVGGTGAGCSLYEAGQAIATGAAYGGCLAPGPGANVIQLPAGIYTQTMKLALDVSTAPAAAGLTIAGASVDTTTINVNGVNDYNFDLTANNITIKDLKIAGDGTPFINGSGTTVSNVAFQPTSYFDFFVVGDNTTINSASLTYNNPTIHGPAFNINGNNANLSNITVVASQNADAVYGDGVDVRGTSATLSNINITDVLGDGIGVYGSFGSVDNATINNTGHDGIGVYGNLPQLTNIHINTTGHGAIGVYGDANMPTNSGHLLLEHINTTGSAYDAIDVYDDSSAAGYQRPVLNDVHVDGTGASYAGIGLYSLGAQLTDVTVQNTGGFGIYMGRYNVPNQPVTFTNVSTNQTGEDGLILSIENNSLTLDHVSILNANTTQQSSQSSIDISAYGSSPVTITNSQITGNLASGGLSMNGDCTDKTISDTYIANNNSSHGSNVYGGGIFNNCGRMTLNRVTVANNYADWGGGIYTMQDFNSTNPAVFTDMTNVTIFNNQAVQFGGGLYLSDSSDGTNTSPDTNYHWNNVTFAGNQAAQGASLYVAHNSAAGPNPIVTNTIFSAATTQQCASDQTLAPLPAGSIGNLSTTGGCFDIANIVSDAGLASSLSTPSTAARIGYNSTGGYLPVLALLASSPAVNSANNASCATIDESNVTRPAGASCDIGAYELTSTPAVAGNNTTGLGVPNTGFSFKSAPFGIAALLLFIAGLGVAIATRFNLVEQRRR